MPVRCRALTPVRYRHELSIMLGELLVDQTNPFVVRQILTFLALKLCNELRVFFLRTMLFVGPYTFVPLEYFINSSSIVILKQAEIYKYFS